MSHGLGFHNILFFKIVNYGTLCGGYVTCSEAVR